MIGHNENDDWNDDCLISLLVWLVGRLYQQSLLNNQQQSLNDDMEEDDKIEKESKEDEGTTQSLPTNETIQSIQDIQYCVIMDSNPLDFDNR